MLRPRLVIFLLALALGWTSLLGAAAAALVQPSAAAAVAGSAPAGCDAEIGSGLAEAGQHHAESLEAPSFDPPEAHGRPAIAVAADVRASASPAGPEHALSSPDLPGLQRPPRRAHAPA